MNHGSHLSDASKKRLIEDTEDWHPRTGTSQSRSFRILAQITGTENGQCQPWLVSRRYRPRESRKASPRRDFLRARAVESFPVIRV